MSKVVNKSQIRVSAIVAMGLGAVITFFAVMNSFGVTSEEKASMDVFEMEILERAIADTYEVEEFELIEEEVASEQIKIYDEDNNLVTSVEVMDGEVVADQETKNMLNRAEFLSEYNNTSIYLLVD